MTTIEDVSPRASNTDAPDSVHSVNGRMLSIACSPDGQVLYAGSYSNLWTSNDGGQNWKQLTWPQPPPDQFDAPGSLGGWCVVDIAVALGWRVEKHPRLLARLVRGGHADIVGFGDCGVWTALGRGDGTFRIPKVVLANFGFQAGHWQLDRHPRFAIDLSGHGRTDIVGFGDAGIWIALGNGDGTFQEGKLVLAAFGYDDNAGAWRVERHPRFLATLTKSGHADIVGFGDAGVWTALGNGDGTFQPAKVVLAAFGADDAAGGWQVEKHPRFVVDLTGDGHADIVGFGDAGVWTALGNGDGTFQAAKFVLAAFGADDAAGGWQVEKHPRFVVDLTGDGHADIVGFGDAGVWTALGNGDGTFQAAKFVLAAFGADDAAGGWQVQKHPRFVVDLTGDGHADIVGFGDAGVWTALGNGDGTFQQAKFVLPYFGYDDQAVGGWRVEKHPRFLTILTKSGHADIVAFGDPGVWTALGNGDGTFQEGKSVLANFGYAATVLALTTIDRIKGSRGIWRSSDGGVSWTKVHEFPANEAVGQLQWALGSDHLVYAALGSSLAISANGGATFQDVFPWGTGPANRVNHVAVWQNAPADPAPAVIYALGDSTMFVSFDGGANWINDQKKLPPNVGGPVGPTGNGNTPNVMVISPRFPGIVYVAANGSSAPTPAVLWEADYEQFPFGARSSLWEPVTVPDAYEKDSGDGSNSDDVFQDSGNVFLATTQRGRGDLLFYGAQRSIAHVGPLNPVASSDWQPLDNLDDFHFDLHGILLSPDFSATIDGDDYNPQRGTVWLLSDGGIYRSTDGGQNFHAAANVRTLSCVNVAGVSIPGGGPALSLNTGDNDGFYSMDGGKTWSYQQYGGGDNDCSFADPLRPHAIMVFTPRWDTAGNQPDHGRDAQTVSVYQTDPGKLPNAAHDGHDRRAVTGPPTVPASISPAPAIWNASSFFGSRGSRPIVLGLAGEEAPAQGDYIFILFKIGAPSVLVRTQNILDIQHREEWLTAATGPGQGANVFQQGPSLPAADVGTVQASGGHAATVFYVGDNAKSDPSDPQFSSPQFGLWSWSKGAAKWKKLVPGGGASHAYRFFVDPYRPNLIYILDDQHVRRSDDGGAHWHVDVNLETQLTWNRKIAISSVDNSSSVGDYFDLVLTDMQFDPNDALVRFAVGEGGAFYTEDGIHWTRLLHAGALPGRPANCYYDWISDSSHRVLYVAFAGRSLMKISIDVPGPAQVVVPNVVEMLAADAAKAVHAAGLVAKFTKTGPRVFRQSPFAGHLVPLGSTVTMELHTGSSQ